MGDYNQPGTTNDCSAAFEEEKNGDDDQNYIGVYVVVVICLLLLVAGNFIFARYLKLKSDERTMQIV